MVLGLEGPSLCHSLLKMLRAPAFVAAHGLRLSRNCREPAATCSRFARPSVQMQSTPAASSSSLTSGDVCSRPEYRRADELLASKGFEPKRDRVVIFDGVCVMCNGGVDFLLKWDTANQFKYAALQSEAGQALALKYNAPRDLSTMVYIEGEQAFVKSDAMLKIGARLFAVAPAARLALIAVPKPLRDWLYSNVIAKNRYDLFGKRDECRLVEPGMEDRFL